MKELALLMFFVGCGYALAKLIERFSPADGRRIFFAIPSQASFNVLWGFVFYLGFAALVILSLIHISEPTTTIGSACFSL